MFSQLRWERQVPFPVGASGLPTPSVHQGIPFPGRASNEIAGGKDPRLGARQPRSPSVLSRALSITCLTKTLFLHPEKLI